MDYDTHFRSLAAEPSEATMDSDEVEIACSDFRLSCRLVLGAFKRLSDLFNHSLGYVVVRDARFLRPNGEPTELEMPELMVRRESIMYVGQAASVLRPKGSARTGGMSDFDRPLLQKLPRRLIFHTPGTAIAANMHMLEEMTLATFLDGSEPRFIPTTAARVRSLADRSVIGEFGLLLLNRAQITAATEARLAGAAAD